MNKLLYGLKPLTNTGVIIKQRPTDWVAGGETGITFKENIGDGQWDSFLPTGEKQHYPLFDTNCCVTYSALNLMETYFHRLLSFNLLSSELVAWLNENGYIDENGHVNFSDRFTAKMSGTTINGNNLGTVWDCIRNDGLLPEKDYCFNGNTWEEYMAEIPQEFKDKAKKFSELFDVKYEWVTIKDPYNPMLSLREQLKQAPIQIVSATCPPWNTDQIINGCGIRTNHATLVYGYAADFIKDYDTYCPFCKKFGLDYAIPYAIKAIIEVKQPPEEPKPFNHTFSRIMKMYERGDEIVALQDFLKIDGDFPLTVNSTGYYGETTRQSVKAFQFKYKVANIFELLYVNGKWCGVKTLTELNHRVALLQSGK